MKKAITMMFCLLLIGFVSIGFAAPFLVWDANPAADNVDKYEVEINGQVAMEVLSIDPLRYDLSGLADGPYTAKVRAHNVWGWSNFSVPFDFDKQVPGAPGGVGLSAE